MLIFCSFNAQHEIKVSIGTFMSSDAEQSSHITNPGYYSGFDWEWSDYTYGNSFSNRAGLEFNIGYAYYIKENLKISTDVSIKQAGNRSTISAYNPDALWFTYDINGGSSDVVALSDPLTVTLDNKINLTYAGVSFGLTYITNNGLTFTAGYSAYNLVSGTLKQEGSLVNGNLSVYNQTIENSLDLVNYSNYQDFSFWDPQADFYYSEAYYPMETYMTLGNTQEFSSSVSGPFFGIGYDWGDFSIDYRYTVWESYKEADDWYESLNGSSIAIGYSKLIIK